jgi:hypothetical protein
VSEQRANEPVVRSPDETVEPPPEHRKRTSRQVRHVSRTQLHVIAGDEEALEDADLLCPQAAHDLGRKSSPRPKKQQKPGRRSGFKVWKTPFWKRRRTMWAERNAQARRIVDSE